jgi:acyl-[acyl-carrier-protein]-phospholipid O-acyltransferase/long-chain-fatty-acid--[acyl-carrier-protein] ligase
MAWKLALAAALLGLAWIWRLQLVRALLLALLHACYRIRVRGLERLPRGGALLVANHLSHGDALFVGAAIPRRVFFLMHRSIFRAPVVGTLAKLFDTIPVASGDSPAEKQESLRRAAEFARRGELVCIFAEGAISRTGHLLGFKHGLETIAREAGVPIVPVVLDRVWGSIFSFARGRVFWKLPQRLPYPIDVIVGEPLAPASEAWRVRDALAAELADARTRRAAESRPLSYRFVRSARAHPARVALVDSGGARITYAELLQSALELAAVLRRELQTEEVRVALPTGADAALLYVALVLAGKTAVPASPYLPPEPGIDAAGLAGLRARITPQDRDAAARIGRMRGRAAARRVDAQPAGARPAVLIHSSGSSGPPKCVVLTQANIASNVQSTSQVFALGPEDAVLGVLPFFHALGYTATIWLPLLSGARAVFHANPLDAPGIAELCRRERPTILLASPTFARAYERRIAAEDFASLRLCVCGAEKLPPELAGAWQAKFGQPLFEGYGATELAPVAAVSVPDFEAAGARQPNHKPGSVGRALPGVALRIVDVRSGALLPPGEPGLLLVRGPNVTPGYRGDPERTAEVLRDGWYATGDVAALDKDGFLTITDRLARFSKLGGEMLPHSRVEEALREAHERRAGASELELVVVGVPDERKGERLVVLHAHARLEPREWLEELARAGLPNLFRPREADFLAVATLPRLATGKLDLAAARARALQR